MIGQANLQSRIEQLIKNHNFPRFSIFVGPKGSGKKTFAHDLERLFNNWRVSSDHVNVYELPDVKIDTVREMITQSYKQIMTMLYIIPDADNMSNAAKNALLKVTEEPPNEAYFIMTLEDENNTLETIRSRGTVFHMDRYTPNEIEEYTAYVYGVTDERVMQLTKELSDTPGDVDTFANMGILEFYDYVELVVDNIAEVSLANAFKIPSKVALKEDVEGYDLKLFWKAVASVMLDRAKQRGNSKELVKYCDGYSVTSKYLQKLRIKGINRSMLMDNWILEIRELWN